MYTDYFKLNSMTNKLWKKYTRKSALGFLFVPRELEKPNSHVKCKWEMDFELEIHALYNNL